MKDIIGKFIDAVKFYPCEEMEIAYRHGFQTGASLIMEISGGNSVE